MRQIQPVNTLLALNFDNSFDLVECLILILTGRLDQYDIYLDNGHNDVPIESYQLRFLTDEVQALG